MNIASCQDKRLNICTNCNATLLLMFAHCCICPLTHWVPVWKCLQLNFLHAVFIVLFLFSIRLVILFECSFQLKAHICFSLSTHPLFKWGHGMPEYTLHRSPGKAFYFTFSAVAPFSKGKKRFVCHMSENEFIFLSNHHRLLLCACFLWVY